MNIKHIVNLKGLGSKTGIASLALLALIGIGMICPMVGEEANAEEPDINHEMVASVRTDTTAYVRSSIAISLTGEAELDLTPTSQGVFSESNDLRLSITTNNTSGYEVYLTTGDNTSILSQKSPANGEGEIKPVSGTMNATNYTSHLDSWGYNISNSTNTNAELTTAAGEFVAIPTSGSGSIVKTDASTSDDSYILKFGASISPSLPAGVYTNTVVASVVANPLEVRSLSDITTMQEMTPEICAISFENETKQLTDSRDGKSYWVAKLADGNCWMTQNLALDITDAGLSAADTDIKEDWNSSSTYPPTKTAHTFEAYEATADDTRSWNFGTLVVAMPEINQGSGATNVNSLVELGILVDVSNATKFKATYSAGQGEWIYGQDSTTISTTVAVNCTERQGNICTSGTYDPHYLTGNYYQFNTATAGSGTGTKFQNDAPQSICPQGWSLPTDAGDPEHGGLINMFKQYGITNNIQGTVQEDGARYNILLNPLYFVRDGMVLPDRGLVNTAAAGNWWSSRVYGLATNAALTNITNSGVAPNSNGSRATGSNIRCINRN